MLHKLFPMAALLNGSYWRIKEKLPKVKAS